MALTIYNTLSKKKEVFKPVTPGQVNIYACGPTVYSDAHIGHAKSYLSFDIVVRWFKYLKYDVLYVQNITDVGHLVDDADEGEDKLQRIAKKRKINPMQIANEYMRGFFDDMDGMGILRPDIAPLATGHLIEQIEMIKELIEKGYAYESNGSVYFEVQKFPEYGKLSGRKVDELEAGARIDVHPDKKHPADFSLWKKADESHLMRWASPWGEGYPGWHIECSAMAMKYLGKTFDIHGGGLDNIFPHHECEIAQSEALTGKPFANIWMHNNTLTMEGEKMSKSLGNVLNISEALKKYSRYTLRFFLLNSHYRSRIDFSETAVVAAEQGLSRLTKVYANLQSKLAEQQHTATETPFSIADFRTQFEDAMNEDFNAPKGIATLFDFTKALNTYLNTDSLNIEFLNEANQLYQDLAVNVLGILPTEIVEESSQTSTDLVDNLIKLNLELRAEMRKSKNWAMSDKIRDDLKAMGVIVKDKPDGTAEWEIE